MAILKFRRIRARNAWIAIVLLGLVTFTSACSTARVRPSHRRGLIDQMNGQPSVNSRANGSNGNKRYDSPADGEYVTRDPDPPRERLGTFRRVDLQWPLRAVQITSPYGDRRGNIHEGLDLKAPVGTKVYAAHSGVVLYSGSKINGYGKLILLRHSSGLATVYAHQSKLLVREGQTIRKGQLIGYSGKTGHSRGPHLHFELRDQSIPFDPLLVMPEPSSTVLAQAEERPVQQKRTRPSKTRYARRLASAKRITN